MKAAVYFDAAWIFLMTIAMPGDVKLLHCDQSVRVVATSTQSFKEHRATTLADIHFRPDADEWERERVAELLRWGAICWSKGCVSADHKNYDPPPPPMKCPPGVPTS